ncbi:MAG: hypothetical protein AAF709_15820, partial [Pseudomonadota bacterium]
MRTSAPLLFLIAGSLVVACGPKRTPRPAAYNKADVVFSGEARFAVAFEVANAEYFPFVQCVAAKTTVDRSFEKFAVATPTFEVRIGYANAPNNIVNKV